MNVRLGNDVSYICYRAHYEEGDCVLDFFPDGEQLLEVVLNHEAVHIAIEKIEGAKTAYSLDVITKRGHKNVWMYNGVEVALRWLDDNLAEG